MQTIQGWNLRNTNHVITSKFANASIEIYFLVWFNQFDVNCWKIGYFQLNNIYNDYDKRRLQITDEILSRVEDENMLLFLVILTMEKAHY